MLATCYAQEKTENTEKVQNAEGGELEGRGFFGGYGLGYGGLGYGSHGYGQGSSHSFSKTVQASGHQGSGAHGHHGLVYG